jgi:hypothetical protein
MHNRNVCPALAFNRRERQLTLLESWCPERWALPAPDLIAGMNSGHIYWSSLKAGISDVTGTVMPAVVSGGAAPCP